MKFGKLIKKKFLEILVFSKVFFKYIESVSNSVCLNLGVMPVFKLIKFYIKLQVTSVLMNINYKKNPVKISCKINLTNTK